MNRQRKEQMKEYLRNHIPLMKPEQQRAFIIMFAPETDWGIHETVDFITGKMLRRAYKHVAQMTRKELS